MPDLSLLGNQLAWLAVIPVLGLLVFWHELGHFAAALWMKVKVEEFGFGYPPRAFTMFVWRGVKFTFNWLPLGGFVRMVGEEGNFDAEGSLTSKRPYQRAIVLLAGPLMNLILAPILYTIVFMSGTPYPLGPVEVTVVAPGSPAAEAGLQVGDQFVDLAGTKPTTTADVSAVTRQYQGRAMAVTVQRGEEVVTVTLVPRMPGDIPEGQGPTGIAIQRSFVTADNLAQAFVMGVRHTGEVLTAMVTGLIELVQSIFIPGSGPGPAGGIAGPVGIARITGELARQGLIPLIELTAFLSLNFFIINLLPLPALDGGRLMFVGLEAVRRGKRIAPEREALVHLAGMVALLALMLVVSYMDLASWWRGTPIFPGQ
jgi:regulator of sigma E protease